MLSWSTHRRLGYLGVIITVLVLVAAGLFIVFKPAPSCFDGKKNQGEAGIDCGGSCQAVCPFEIVKLKVLWTRVFTVADHKYDTATMIQNPNPGHGVRGLKYAVKIYDANNLLINVKPGEVFVNPGEKLIVFDSRLDTGQLSPARAVFELREPPRWQKIDREAPKLVVTSKVFINGPIPRLTAQVANQSLLDLKNIQVLATLSDGTDNVLAISSTLIERLDRGATQEIVFTWPAPLPVEPLLIDLYPHLDLALLPS